MYQATTNAIKVTVEPAYVVEHSSPTEGYYFWSYTVEIENQSKESICLRKRHWRITDANGGLQEVRGQGVVGEEPTIEPGTSFTYTSGAPLTTPSGFMAGSYRMETPSGTEFDVDIPTFSLDSPFERQTLN